MRPYTWRGDYEMDGRSYKNYKIALTHSKLSYNYIDFSILESPSVFHEVLTEHYNVQETIHVLKSNDP